MKTRTFTRNLSILAVTIGLLIAGVTASAAPILSDSFANTAGGADDYTIGALQNQTATVGTTGYTGAWSGGTSFNQNTSGGLTHISMTGTSLDGRVMSYTSQNFNARVLYRAIDYTPTTGTYYFSALFSKSTENSADMLVGLGGASTHQTSAANYNTFGIRSGGALFYRNTEIVSSANFAVDTTYLGVMEINYDSAGADSIIASFYDESATLVGSQTFSGLNIDANMGQILVGTASQGNNNAFVDEIRYGTTLADVFTEIPEPSTAILAGLGLMGVCFRRRRK